MEETRDSMQYDVVVVGAGPSGLSAAIRLKQLAHDAGREVSVCVVDKGSEVGAHIMSGAVIDTKALAELFPDWQMRGAPLNCPVNDEHFRWLSDSRSFPLPVPPVLRNEGCHVASLGLLCRWLAEQAESLGVEIYPGFAAAEILYDDNGTVCGIATGDMGLEKDGTPGADFACGMELLATQTIFAEGCRGSLSRELETRFDLRRDKPAQTYGLGIKEIWEIEPALSRPGSVLHTVGWPLDSKTYGGAFLYHMDDNRIAVGMVVGLDYENPYLSPFEEFQRLKTHPSLRPLFESGRRIEYGARSLVEGGLNSLPKTAFAGGVLVGDAAGFLNMARIKGTHTAMKSGMLAAESVFDALQTQVKTASYESRFRESWLYRELFAVRNIRGGFRAGLWMGMANAALEQYVLRGRAPWSLAPHRTDAGCLKKAAAAQPINYPKPDGKITFDRLSSVFLSGTNHRDGEPPHLKPRDEDALIAVNYREYASPETRYCPAGVYEIVEENGSPRLQINAQNCLHCKTCDIKDPQQNIVWTCPEGGGGPNYTQM